MFGCRLRTDQDEDVDEVEDYLELIVDRSIEMIDQMRFMNPTDYMRVNLRRALKTKQGTDLLKTVFNELAFE